MPKYSVEIPVAGFFVATVDAANEEAAIRAALSHDWSVSLVNETGPHVEDFSVGSLDVYERLEHGAARYYPLGEAVAEPVEE